MEHCKGLVSFADNGAVLISPMLSEVARIALGVDHVAPLKGLRKRLKRTAQRIGRATASELVSWRDPDAPEGF
jgi:hypothetical protein